MSIEDVAHKNPEKIFKIPIDVNKELDVEALCLAAKNLGLEDYKSQVVFLFKHIFDCFMDKDADLIEINPLVLTKDG
jgi:succinyl-CoA synthetase beta subunit